MKLIVKQKEPIYLKNHRLKITTNDDGTKVKATYESFCKEIGLGDIQPPTGFRKFLLEEQGYLCVYCMRQIPHKHIEKEVEKDDMKIEHHTPQTDAQSISGKLDITHSNMFGCCMGGKGKERKFQTCDTRKGNDKITINPTDKLHIDTIKYGLDGLITSTNPAFEDDINRTLNLNENNLKKRREAIYQVVDKKTKDAYKVLKDRKAKNEYLNQEIELWLKTKDLKHKEYCMVAVVYLRSRIK
jgi:uncharacterized protein (TIGR02646 family)